MRGLAFIMALALIFLGSTVAVAHAPKNVELQFDLGDKELEVTIYHQVTDAAKHYVNSVVVELNGDKIIEQKISEQEDLKFHVLKYRVTDARVGDTITVVAGCNISGKKKASLKIAPPAEGEDEKEEKEDD